MCQVIQCQKCHRQVRNDGRWWNEGHAEEWRIKYCSPECGWAPVLHDEVLSEVLKRQRKRQLRRQRYYRARRAYKHVQSDSEVSSLAAEQRLNSDADKEEKGQKSAESSDRRPRPDYGNAMFDTVHLLLGEGKCAAEDSFPYW